MSDDTNRGTCRECDFWRENFQNSDYGECRVRAPFVFFDSEELRPRTAFPETLETAWCGEWVTLQTKHFPKRTKSV